MQRRPFDEQMTQQYNWTPAGAVSSIDTQHGGSTTDSQCFSYDYLQRLTVAFTTTPGLGGCAAAPSASTVGGPDAYWQTYAYDNTGNRTGLTSHGLGGAGDTTTTYTYPQPATAQAHTLRTAATTGPAGSTSKNYIYDPNGQQTNATVNGLSTDYTWEDFNRVATTTVHAPTGDQTTSYVYDAEGDELLRATPTGKTLYLDTTEITTNATGNTLTNTTRYYTCGDTTIASRTNPGTLSWLTNDDQNTAQVAVDATTLAASIRKQDPFGNPRGTVPNWPNSRGFVGGTTEPTGLIHLGARQYDASTGRFISDDAVTDHDNPQQLNGYAYAYNSPLTYTDPTGLWGWHSILHTVAKVAEVVSYIPGPIGTAAAAVSAVAYAANGEFGQAAIMAATAVANLVGAGAVLHAAVGAVAAIKVAKLGIAAAGVVRVGKAVRGGAAVVRAGQRGERAARVVKNTQTILINGRKRIPDYLSLRLKRIGEVKNVRYQWMSRQLRDDLDYAQQKGYKMILWTRKNTRLSERLKEHIGNGLIEHRHL